MKDQTVCVSPPAISEDGYVSLTTPVHRASTIVFPNAAAYANRAERGPDGYSYGLGGTPTTRRLQATLNTLAGAEGTLLLPSGQAAIMLVFVTVLKPGDTVLIPDCAYPPVRSFCQSFLAERGIGFRVYDPDWSPDQVGDLIDDSVKLLWIETPGSATMEMVDVGGLVKRAHAKGVLVGCDNTWATPLNFKPVLHGVDFVIEALTKYAGGHSDLLMGSVSVRQADWYPELRTTMSLMGLGVSPDDCSLVLRGLETMSLRLRHAAKTAFDFARQIAERIPGELVLHPALPHSPSHALWKRDFAGASGVFSIIIPDHVRDAVIKQVDAAQSFSIGASWGGTHSLLAPMSVADERSFVKPEHRGTILRISIGLEDPADLWADLERIVAVIEG